MNAIRMAAHPFMGIINAIYAQFFQSLPRLRCQQHTLVGRNCLRTRIESIENILPKVIFVLTVISSLLYSKSHSGIQVKRLSGGL